MAGSFIRPVPGPITGPFNEIRSYEIHEGVDIGCPVGTNVLAAASGTVSFAELNGTYGNVIYIDHPNGDQTRYAHLSKFSVPKGTKVIQAQVIGLSGGAAGAAGSGNSTGPHLHHEHRVGGVPQDPTKWWGADDTGSGNGVLVTNPVVDTKGNGGNPIAGAADFFNFVNNGQNWRRIGIGALGVALLIIAVVKITSDTGVGQTVISTAKKAAEVAAVA